MEGCQLLAKSLSVNLWGFFYIHFLLSHIHRTAESLWIKVSFSELLVRGNSILYNTGRNNFVAETPFPISTRQCPRAQSQAPKELVFQVWCERQLDWPLQSSDLALITAEYQAWARPYCSTSVSDLANAFVAEWLQIVFKIQCKDFQEEWKVRAACLKMSCSTVIRYYPVFFNFLYAYIVYLLYLSRPQFPPFGGGWGLHFKRITSINFPTLSEIWHIRISSH